MITPNFTASQNYGDIRILTLTDTSTGTNTSPTIQNRLVYIRKADGTYLVPENTTTDFVVWPYSSNSIDIDVLDKDYAVDITVKYLSGSSIEFTKVILFLFKAYSELFLYNLTQYQTSNKRLTQSENYYYNKMKLRVFVDDAIQAVSQADDQAGAQLCLDMAKELTDNQTYFF